jgi:hypothetical protein
MIEVCPLLESHREVPVGQRFDDFAVVVSVDYSTLFFSSSSSSLSLVMSRVELLHIRQWQMRNITSQKPYHIWETMLAPISAAGMHGHCCTR